MKVLIIGNANSIWLKSVIDHTLPSGKDIKILSYENQKFCQWYEEKEISVLQIPKNKFGKLNMFIAARQLR